MDGSAHQDQDPGPLFVTESASVCMGDNCMCLRACMCAYLHAQQAYVLVFGATLCFQANPTLLFGQASCDGNVRRASTLQKPS